MSQINNYTLAPISDERVGEAAGVNSSISSFGLSVGLAFTGAILLAALSISFSSKADASTVLAPAQKDHVADVLEHDAQVMSDAQLEKQIASEPPAIQDGDPAHQRRSTAEGTSDRAARSAARLTGRARNVIPNDAPARSSTIGRRRVSGVVATREADSGRRRTARSIR